MYMYTCIHVYIYTCVYNVCIVYNICMCIYIYIYIYRGPVNRGFETKRYFGCLEEPELRPMTQACSCRSTMCFYFSLYIYIYIYIMCIHIYIYIYIYALMETPRLGHVDVRTLGASSCENRHIVKTSSSRVPRCFNVRAAKHKRGVQLGVHPIHVVEFTQLRIPSGEIRRA